MSTAGPEGVVRVLVVDDSDAARLALAKVVDAARGFTLVGSSSSGTAALESLAHLDPDLVLLDVHMPCLSGPETAERMAESRPDIHVVLVSATPETAATVPGVVPKHTICPDTLRELWVNRAS